jgi:hypothetical protein
LGAANFAAPDAKATPGMAEAASSLEGFGLSFISIIDSGRLGSQDITVKGRLMALFLQIIIF